MGVYISNFPNPIQIIRSESTQDMGGRPWQFVIVDPALKSPQAYAVYRGDVTQRDRFPMVFKGRRDIWFRIHVSQVAAIKKLIRSKNLNPSTVKGIFYKYLQFGNGVQGRLTAPPSWSSELLTVIR